ncbi:MAG: hypothetical protein BIFFINMI_01804 [Phycisphaerae bacterium]|nr:hypothetical protein [Phycisphaerae bacterium]
MKLLCAMFAMALPLAALADDAPPTTTAPDQAVRPMRFIRNKSVEGMDRLECNTTVLIDGDRVLIGSHYGGGVNLFKRDRTSGDLTWTGFIDIDAIVGKPGQHLDSFTAVAGGRLYVVAVATHASGNGSCFGMMWFDLAGENGKPKLLGRQKCDAGQPVAAPDGKSLYLQAYFTGAVYQYTLAADGTPQEVAKAAGLGLTGTGPLSPDGRFLYSISLRDQAIGCVRLGDGGKPEYVEGWKLADSLKPVGSLRSGCVAISPDGRHAYATANGYGLKDEKGKFTGYNAFGQFTRDPATGRLTFDRLIPVNPKMVKIVALIFRPDGRTAYYCCGTESSGNGVGWLTCDPQSGELAFGGWTGQYSNGAAMAWAPDTGTLYVPSWRIGNSGVHLFATARAKPGK